MEPANSGGQMQPYSGQMQPYGGQPSGGRGPAPKKKKKKRFSIARFFGRLLLVLFVRNRCTDTCALLQVFHGLRQHHPDPVPG